MRFCCSTAGVAGDTGKLGDLRREEEKRRIEEAERKAEYERKTKAVKEHSSNSCRRANSYAPSPPLSRVQSPKRNSPAKPNNNSKP